MSLGLSHSLSRHKLKFSPDKIDTMIIQAIALLDDLDKELNTYAMRVKEWYGWHFPEMGRIVNDNLAYAKVILKMGMRTSASTADLAEVLPEEIETAVKAAAEVSMGTEITTEDLDNIQALAEQVVDFTEYRQQLSSYLSARMEAVAPNLTALVGDLVGARLIAHSGSLMGLAKSPASTIQILGAEKALFRALKTKHDTPKYGLIYHASLIGQATGKNKGKIARVLAAKAAIGIRVDALAEWSAEGEGKGDLVTEEEKAALGNASRIKIERRLAGLEGKPIRSKGVGIAPNGASSQPGKWEIKEARKYNPDADGLAGDEEAAAAPKIKEASKPKSIEKPDIKMIEEVDGAGDEEMSDAKASEDEESEDEEMADDPAPVSRATTTLTLKTNGIAGKDKSEAASDLSSSSEEEEGSEAEEEPKASTLAESEDQPKVQLTPEEEAKALKKQLRAQRRARKVERRLRREAAGEGGKRIPQRELDKKEYGAMAKLAKLPVSRYKRKLLRNEIIFDAEGIPHPIPKENIKKARKEQMAQEEAEKARKAALGDAAYEGETEKERKNRKRKEREREEKKEKKRLKKEAKEAKKTKKAAKS